MSIRLKRFPKSRLDFSVYSGVVTVEQVLRHFARLDPTANWLSYFDATADISAVDLGHYPVLKRGLMVKEAERDSDELRLCLLVNAAPINEDFVRFWCAYAAEDIEHAHQRDMLPSLDAAFDRLGLPDETRAAVLAEIAPGEPAGTEADRP
jgi:hypothetical protein